jgi:hypothetical protein
VTEDRKAKMLEKVRALLAKAASTPYSEEAALLQAKADELMAKFAIEEWELAKASGGQQKPDRRDFDISWWYDMELIEDALWSLFWKCAAHARCVIVYWKSGAVHRTIPVVGMPNDLDYFDMLFTDLMTQLVGSLSPKADREVDYFTNLKRMREAGMSWPDAAKKMLAAGFDPRPDSDSFKVKQDQMTRDYRNECKKRGIEQNYNHFKTYGRNFSTGFVTAIGVRFRESITHNTGEQTGSMALALRDIGLVVRDAATEMFGQPPKSRGGGLVRDNRKVDLGAQGAGVVAGQNARIASNSAGLRSQRQLDK